MTGWRSFRDRSKKYSAEHSSESGSTPRLLNLLSSSSRLRRLSRLRKIDSPAHAEMDNEKGLLPASVLLQANQQILRPAAETRHPAAWELSPQTACIYRIAQPGLPHIDPLDHLSLEEPLETSSYSFDFRQLRHGSQLRHIL